MKFRHRIGLLIGLMVLELLLIYSLRYRGWNETGDSGIFLQALLITSVPIVVAILCLVQSGRKVALRTVMLVIACLAFFLSLVVMPLRDALDTRGAAIAFVDADIKFKNDSGYLNTHKFLGWDFRQEEKPTPYRLPFWLSPLVGEWAEFSADCEIESVTVINDEQLITVLENAERLKNLRLLIVEGQNIDTALVRKFVTSNDRFPSVRWLVFSHQAVIPKELENWQQLELLSFFSCHLSETEIEFVKLSQVKLLNFSAVRLTTLDLQKFEDCKNLRYLGLHRTGMQEADLSDFCESHPECRIDLK